MKIVTVTVLDVAKMLGLVDRPEPAEPAEPTDEEINEGIRRQERAAERGCTHPAPCRRCER